MHLEIDSVAGSRLGGCFAATGGFAPVCDLIAPSGLVARRFGAKPILVSVGHEDGTAAIEAGAIFREALKAGAEEIIVAHNHPSGDPTPSKADIAATKELKDLASRLKVVFLDHIIIGDAEDFRSLAEAGDL